MTIDLASLPPPDVVETIDFEAILANRKEALLALLPDDQQAEMAAALSLLSDPTTKLLEENAYREMTLRQRINDAARSVMLAYAKGSDLDQIGGNYGVERLVVTAGDPAAIPPTADEMEDDPDYRFRILLSLEGYTTAGSEASYTYHALSASGQVLDAKPVSPGPGLVTVYVLSRSGNGVADDALLDTVEAALNVAEVRPMTDNVSVLSASIVTYTIEASLIIASGPDADVVLSSARAAAEAYVADQHRLDADISLSGIYRALHQPGVLRVDLVAPSGNIAIAEGQAPWCTDIVLTIGDTGG